MSFEPKADEAKSSQQSGDEHDNPPTNVELAESEDAGSMVAEPDNDNYQDLHPAEIDAVTPSLDGGIVHGSLGFVGSPSDEILGNDPILELDDNDYENFDADAGAARPDATQDLADMGAIFSDGAIRLDPVPNIEL